MQWLAALGHHVQAKAGVKATDMVEMMVCQKDVMDVAVFDSSAFQLAHSAFATVNQDRGIAMHKHVGRLCPLGVLHRATGGS